MKPAIAILAGLFVAAGVVYWLVAGSGAASRDSAVVMPSPEASNTSKPEPQPAGGITGTVSGMIEDDVAYISIAKGTLKFPDTLTSDWLKANADRVVFKTELEGSDNFSFDDVPVGNYTAMVAIMNKANPTPPAEWRTAAQGVTVIDGKIAEVLLDAE